MQCRAGDTGDANISLQESGGYTRLTYDDYILTRLTYVHDGT